MLERVLEICSFGFYIALLLVSLYTLTRVIKGEELSDYNQNKFPLILWIIVIILFIPTVAWIFIR